MRFSAQINNTSGNYMVVFVTLPVNFIPETTRRIFVEFGNLGYREIGRVTLVLVRIGS
jgi:hypothetical protein